MKVEGAAYVKVKGTSSWGEVLGRESLERRTPRICQASGRSVWNSKQFHYVY